jgi:hypothetical protein
MAEIKITRYDSNPNWDSMSLKQKWSEWEVSSHSDGDIEIECITDAGSSTLILNQDELKQFIQFLQEKVK